MSTKPQELSKIIADLRQIIVGKVAMPTDQIEQITLFLFLKQLSRKHDDLVRIGSKELIFNGVWERYHFDVLMRHSGEELVKECREAVESLYKNPNIDATVRKVFERSYLKILEPKVLSLFLQYLNDKFSDGLDLGDFYESLLPILGTQNELGQFRTPRHIIKFIVSVIDPNIGEKIADPACGTAGFLVAAFNHLKDKYTDEKGKLKLNPEQIKKLYNETIFGWDSEPLMVKFSLANLYLHGLKVPNVSENDTLVNENLWQHTFDIIVANPPFITPKGGAHRHSRFAIASNKTEVLFCEWMVHHLNFNGRTGFIVPQGIIFDASKGHQALRKLFLDNGLWCVVSLPSGVFQPYSGVKTNIIFLDKTLKPDQILFCEIENHGFTLNTNPSPTDKNDLPRVLEVIKNYSGDLRSGKQTIIDELKCYTISKQKVLENSALSLQGVNYRDSGNKDQDKWPMIELGKVLDYEQPTKYIVSSVNYSDTYQTPVLTAGKTFILGYTKEKDGIFKNDLPVIIFDDFTTATKLVDFPFKVKSSAMKILHAKKEIANIKFLFYMMQQIKFSSKTHKRYWISQYSKIKIPLPPLKIQEQIVAELDNLEEEIKFNEKETKSLKLVQNKIISDIWSKMDDDAMSIPFMEKVEIDSELRSVATLLDHMQNNAVDSFFIYFFENTILSLREVAYLIEKYFSAKLDNISKDKIKQITKARNAICHRSSPLNYLSIEKQIKFTGNIAKGKCNLVKIGDDELKSEFDDDVAVFYGKLRIYVKRDVIYLFEKFSKIINDVSKNS